MWNKTIGRRSESRQSEPPRQTVDASEFPWTGHEDETACNLAFGHLVHNLIECCMDGDRLHPETALAAIGATAGFAMQRALLARMAADERDPAHGQLQMATTSSGARFLFAEPLNQMFFAHDSSEMHRLWPLAAGAAIAAGLGPDDLPKPESFFAHVSRAIGGDTEGWPSVPPQHRPKLAFGPLLKAAWPIAKTCLTGDLPGIPHEIGVAPREFWPVITAHAAGSILRRTSSALDPRIGLTLMMEAAVYGSKMDPAVVDATEKPLQAA